MNAIGFVSLALALATGQAEGGLDEAVTSKKLGEWAGTIGTDEMKELRKRIDVTTLTYDPTPPGTITYRLVAGQTARPGDGDLLAGEIGDFLEQGGDAAVKVTKKGFVAWWKARAVRVLPKDEPGPQPKVVPPPVVVAAPPPHYVPCPPVVFVRECPPVVVRVVEHWPAPPCRVVVHCPPPVVTYVRVVPPPCAPVVVRVCPPVVARPCVTYGR